MRSRSDLKMRAKMALKGNMGKLILAALAAAGLSLAGSMLTTVLFPGYGTVDIILSQLFSFILSLVLSVVSAGLSFMFLNTARGRVCSFGDLFYFFRNHPDRVITATFVLALIEVITALPMSYYSFAVDMGNTLEAQMTWLSDYALLMVLAIVLNVLLTLPFAMVYYILADNPEMSGMEALKTSARMMKGKLGRFLLLQISFVPLLLLSAFTLYLALIWIMPYMDMTFVMFYRDITGEFDRPLGTEALPYSGFGRNDDYNSEA